MNFSELHLLRAPTAYEKKPGAAACKDQVPTLFIRLRQTEVSPSSRQQDIRPSSTVALVVEGSTQSSPPDVLSGSTDDTDRSPAEAGEARTSADLLER